MRARSRLSVVGLVTGCVIASGAGVVATPSHAASLSDTLHRWIQDGEASYYGNHWVGHRTTSGARFDQSKLTAAHASLPLGTRLLVTCQESGESVVVTVNDRQPDHGDRIIDLSRAAASRLGMIGRGVADVEIATATPHDIALQDQLDSASADEVAEAPDDDGGLGAARVTRARHGLRHRHLARR